MISKILLSLKMHNLLRVADAFDLVTLTFPS